MSAADPFQELVDTLKRILTRSPSPPLPASTSTPVTSAINSSSPVMFASPMARPAPYSGDPEECNGFLLQCLLTIDLHPQMFLTDQAKIAFVITSLTGPALRWAESVLNQAGPLHIPMASSSPISEKSSAAHQGTRQLANSYTNCDRAL